MAEQIKGRAAQDFLPIQSIRDGVVVMTNNTHCMILLVSSLNFALRSADEQNAIIFQFQQFLNSLDFPAQIYLQSRRLDVGPYLVTLEDRMHNELNELLKIQIREYIQFVRSYTESSNIMKKKFFVVIPYTPGVLETKGRSGFVFRGFMRRSKEENTAHEIERFEEYRTQLEQRASVVTQGLMRFGVRSVLLGTEELIELFFKLYNPGDQTALK
ncbi:MAG: hypothetical protein Q8P93_04420 [bacterium]|nr:hypothetical protein [bacterium]